MGAPTQEQVDNLQDALRNPAQTVEQSRDSTRITYRPFAELSQMAAQAAGELEAAGGSTKAPRIMRARIMHGTEEV